MVVKQARFMGRERNQKNLFVCDKKMYLIITLFEGKQNVDAYLKQVTKDSC